MPKRLRVTADGLWLRAEPKLTGKIVKGMGRDEVVDWLDTSGDGYWQKIRRKDGAVGWASHKYLVAAARPATPEEFPWMTVALREKGTKEYAGAADNPRVVQYLASTTLGSRERSNDETPWCSAFVNWCVEQAGRAGTDSAWARSWLTWGKKVATPRRGCIAVLTRGTGGHVAFFVETRTDHVVLLGGNQSDRVGEQAYPAERVLGYRVPL